MGSSIDLTNLNLLPISTAKTDRLLRAEGMPGPNGSITWERNQKSILDQFDIEELDTLSFTWSKFTATICKQAIEDGKTGHELAKEYARFKGLGRSTLYAYYAPLLRAQKRRLY